MFLLLKKCKQIAQSKEDDDVIVNKPHVSDEEEEEPPFYHHPFKLSEPKPIFFNLNVSISAYGLVKQCNLWNYLNKTQIELSLLIFVLNTVRNNVQYHFLQMSKISETI